MNESTSGWSARLQRIDDFLDSHKRWLIGLFLVAFLIKLTYILQSANALHVMVPIMDSAYYASMAQDILAGNIIRERAFFMGPLYPYHLAVVFSVVGKSIMVARVIQVAAGAATVVMTYLLGRRVMRPSIALVAAVLLLLYGAMTFYEGQLLMMWLGTFLNMLALLVLLLRGERGGYGAYIVSGVLLGLSALARANILMFVAAVVVWILYVARESQRVKKAAVFVAAVLMTVFPATLHNFIAGGEFIPITANGGFNFYIGNSDRATGIFYPPKGINLASDETARKHVERLIGRKVTDAEASGWWVSQAFDYIVHNPIDELKLLLRKTAMYFNGYEVPQIEAYEVARTRYVTLRVLFVNYWMILALAVLGMAALLRQWRKYFLLYAYVFAFAFSIILFFVAARYRAQTAPVMCLFAAYGLVTVLPGIFQAMKKNVLPLMAFLLIVLVTRPGLFALPADDVVWREHTHEARRLSELGKYSEAVDEINRAVAIHPDYADSYIQRAVIHKERGKNFEAIGDYTKALELNPDMASVHYDLGQALRRVRMYEPAIESYLNAIELNPAMIEAYNNIGITFRHLKAYEQAATYFAKVIELDPGYVKAYNNLGATLAEAGQPQQAIRVFEEAIALDPMYPNSYRNLSMAYVRLGNARAALQAMEHYAQLNPGDAKVQETIEKLRIAVEADTTTVHDSN